MTHDVSPGDVLDRLRTVTDPDIGQDIVAAGLVESVSIDGATVRVRLALGAPFAPSEAAIADDVRAALDPLPVDVDLSAVVPELEPEESAVLPSVTNIIPVASGKGGVGKSTVAVNLASGLADRGARVGLFDADVYGPDTPRMLGVDTEPTVTAVDGDQRIEPPTSGGVPAMSMGLLVDDEDPVAWRGAMATNALTDLVSDVSWGSLDYLIVDLPPGTGDIPMTILQRLPSTGTVIVTTPQSVAADDTRKGLELFSEYREPVLGVVENMCSFVCPDCGNTHDIFGTGGGERLAAETGVPFLGQIPLDPTVRASGDDGEPVVRRERGEAAAAFERLTATVADSVGTLRRTHHREAVRGDA